MQVRLLDNITHRVDSTLIPIIERASDVRIAAAYVSRSGLDLLEPAILSAVDSCASVEFLVGLDGIVTEPGALRWLLQLSMHHRHVSLYCHVPKTPGVLYHPKLYLFRGDVWAAALVGSSNLTRGGLRANVEANALLEATPEDEVISGAYLAYAKLKFHPARVEPDEALVELYEEAFAARRRAPGERRAAAAARRVAEHARGLRRPSPRRSDLVGWLELVYDALPQGEFTNQDVYALQGVFQRRYPENRHVKAKVRQQLQYLAEMGFLEHLGPGRWRKL